MSKCTPTKSPFLAATPPPTRASTYVKPLGVATVSPSRRSRARAARHDLAALDGREQPHEHQPAGEPEPPRDEPRRRRRGVERVHALPQALLLRGHVVHRIGARGLGGRGVRGVVSDDARGAARCRGRAGAGGGARRARTSGVGGGDGGEDSVRLGSVAVEAGSLIT